MQTQRHHRGDEHEVLPPQEGMNKTLDLEGAVATNDMGLCGQSVAQSLGWPRGQFPKAVHPHVSLVTPTETCRKEGQIILHQGVLIQTDS